MARYIPKHRRQPSLAERRRALGIFALAVSSVVGLTGTYGFVPGVQAAAPPVAGPAAARSSSVSRLVSSSEPPVVGTRTQLAPAFLDVEAIGATSSLIPLGLRDDGSLEVPEVASQAGWYSAGVAPGEVGPAVIVGHVDSYLGSAVFGRLHELKPGDLVRIARTDGTTLRFAVRRVDQYPKDFFPTDLVYGTTNTAELRLITCGGAFNRKVHSYRDNVVVYADLVE
jgi:hypothetical protein